MGKQRDSQYEDVDNYEMWSNSFWSDAYWDDWKLYDVPDECKNILIVEDDTSTVKLFKTMIKVFDDTVRIRSVNSAEKAEKYIRHLKMSRLPGPDIALIDYSLRARDGLYVCQLLDIWFPQTRTIMVSGLNAKEVCKKLEEKNLKVEFIPKPLERRQISHILRG